MWDHAVAHESELYSPLTYTVPDWVLRALFLLFDPVLNTLPIAVVCATWSGLGIFLITLFEYLVFEQAMDWRVILGLLLIVTGVILVNSLAPHK